MEKRDDSRISSAGVNQSPAEIKKKLPREPLRRLVSFGVATALAAGLAGCAGENEVKATPEATQTQVEEVIPTEEATSTPEEVTSAPEVDSDTGGKLEYEIMFPNPVVDESILEELGSVESFYDRMVIAERFYAANGVNLLTDEDISEEGFAQKILDNYQHRTSLIIDTMAAGYESFAVTVAENSLTSSQQDNYLSLPDEYTEGFISPNYMNGLFEAIAQDSANGNEISPVYDFGAVVRHTGPSTELFTHTLWMETNEGSSAFSTRKNVDTFQLVFEVAHVPGDDDSGMPYHWVPLLVAGMENPGENGPLQHTIAGGDPNREIFEVK